MNPATGHLTDAQIENYVSQDGTAKNPDAQSLRLEAHLADCESCLGRVLDVERIRLGLLEGDRMRETPYPGCPTEETLQELAAGIGPSETTEATTEHAAHCDFCGPRLSRYVREFSESLEEEDAALLEQLKSSRPGWQREFVRKYVATPKPKPFVARFWPKLATAAMAVVAVSFGLYFYLRPPDDLNQARTLVASAAADRRTTEMRLPGAQYGTFNPVPVVKGPGDGGDWKSVPASLVEAEALLKQKSGAGELSPQWLQVEGRIDLLQGSARSIDEAVDAFEKALARNADNLGLRVDLATAYFEKEMRADHERPVLTKTMDLLKDVIKNAKADDSALRAAALFDLAIAYEKSKMNDFAVDTWRQYLQVDGSSDWAREARKHLETLEKAMPPPKAQGYAEPSYFLAHSSEPEVLQDLEEYQDIAMRSWLPAAVENRSSESGRATAKLAELLRQHHSDSWLEDFLSQTTTADLPAARMLSAAFTYDWNDLHHQAIRESQNAATIFAKRGNLPGELRARYQEVYGLQRSLAGDDCLQQINKLWQRVFSTKYRWLQAQLALEKATCANLTLNFDTAATTISMSRKIAGQFGFSELTLRVTGFEAGIQQWQQNYDGAWKKAVQGVNLYWQGKCLSENRSPPAPTGRALCPYSWERLYQFYSVMQQCARKMALPHISEALLLRGISILEDNAPDNIGLRTMLYLKLANILSQQRDTALAEAEAGKAELLLKESPAPDSTAQIYAAVTRIELAEFELNQGHGELALSKIEPLRPVLANQDDFVKLDFYTVEGEIYRRLGQFDKAAAAFESGISVAESSLDSKQDGARLNWISATAKTYRGLTRTLLEQNKTTEALTIWELFLGRSLEQNGAEGAYVPNSTSSIQPYPSLPSPSEPHLVYASFEDGLQIWTVSGSTIRGQWVPMPHDTLKQQIVEFAAECSNPSLPLEKAQALYTAVLEPVIPNLPAKGTVAVELDDTLWGLTFEALRDREGHYFADDHTVVYSPGLLAEQALRQPEPLTLREPMLLVDASLSIETAPLPGHSEEVTAVKRTFANTKSVGPAGITPEGIRRALAESSEFHFSGHGKRDGTGTALVIGSGLLLEASDFTPDRLRHMQLAVLSACASGSSKKGALDQSNLVRSFLSGGVPSVIASRWDVDSKSTAHFMQAFYGHLRSGAPASQALQYAQAEMRSMQSHPYYWAAFNLTGRVN